MKNQIKLEDYYNAESIINAMDDEHIEFNQEDYDKYKNIVSDFHYFNQLERESHYVTPHYPNCKEGSIYDY